MCRLFLVAADPAAQQAMPASGPALTLEAEAVTASTVLATIAMSPVAYVLKRAVERAVGASGGGEPQDEDDGPTATTQRRSLMSPCPVESPLPENHLNLRLRSPRRTGERSAARRLCSDSDGKSAPHEQICHRSRQGLDVAAIKVISF